MLCNPGAATVAQRPQRATTLKTETLASTAHRPLSLGRRLVAPQALWTWGFILAIAIFSYYCHVLDEQVKRAKKLHTPVVSQEVASIAVLQTLSKPAAKGAAAQMSSR